MATAYDYEAWCARIDDLIWYRTGCGREDLPDCLYHDWYDEGLTPLTAAIRAIGLIMADPVSNT